MSPAFLLTSLIVVVAPGTGVLYTLSAGLSRGTRASIAAAFGCTLGILPHLAAAITGLAALLYASSIAFQVLKILGCVYLLYMAWNTLRETGALDIEGRPSPGSTSRIVLRGILINILNPKLSLFFFDGRFSHAVTKVAVDGDFRVQPQFGGRVSEIAPEREALRAAEMVLEAAGPALTYARVDLIRGLDHTPQLMELEVIEPDLFLEHAHDQGAAFAEAVVRAIG